MKTTVYYWLQAIAPGYNKSISPGSDLITRMEARLSLTPLWTKYTQPDEDDWEWPGEQSGHEELEHGDGSLVPETLHIVAHYHDNYFDCVELFTDLEQARAK